MFVAHRKHAYAAGYGDSFTLLYVDDVRTSQETHASTVSYKNGFICVGTFGVLKIISIISVQFKEKPSERTNANCRAEFQLLSL
jgi:hypothetical protein